MVQVQQRALRSLEDHSLTLLNRRVHQRVGIGNERTKHRQVVFIFTPDVFESGTLGIVYPFEQAAFLLQRTAQRRCKSLGLAQVRHADTFSRRLIGVCGTNAPAGSSDLCRAALFLLQRIQ